MTPSRIKLLTQIRGAIAGVVAFLSGYVVWNGGSSTASGLTIIAGVAYVVLTAKIHQYNQLKLKKVHDEESGLVIKQLNHLIELDEQKMYTMSEEAELADKTMQQSAEALEKLAIQISHLSERNADLETKVYAIELTCPYCNLSQPVEYNMAAGESSCTNCKNLFAIHTNIYTARITSPINSI